MSYLIKDDSIPNAICDNEFQNTLLFSTPALLHEVKRYLTQDIKAVKSERILTSVVKYLSRMSTRCTPFSAFAGCSMVKIGNSHSLIATDSLDEVFSLDRTYYNLITRKLEADKAIRRFLNFSRNDTIYSIAKEYRYISCDSTPIGRQFNIRAIKKTKLLKHILEYTNIRRTFNEILSSLTNSFQISSIEAENYINSLVNNQILISNISPKVTGDVAQYDLLKSLIPKDTNSYKLIDTIENTLGLLSLSRKNNENLWDISKVTESFKDCSISINSKFLIQHDTYRKLENACLSKSILKSLEQAFRLLRKLSPGVTNSLLNDFCKRFTARYQDRELPLLEVLDPNVGIGYITTNDSIANPLVEGLHLPFKAYNNGILNCPLYKLLEQKLFKYNASFQEAIELTDDDVNQFQSIEKKLPLSIAAIFNIIDYNPTLDEYKLQNVHFSGASAGNMLGRFTTGSKDIEYLVSTICNCEQEFLNNAIIAEIVHLPEIRIGNILHRTHFRTYELTYLTGSDLNNNRIIPVNDLLMRVVGHDVILRSKRLNKRIIPRLTTAHNFNKNGSPLYRFLCDLQSHGIVPSLYFSWCGLENIHSFLPRVNYKNIILSPARWKVPADSIYFKQQNLDMATVNQWKRIYNLPDEVLLAVGDNKLYVNFNLKYSIKALLSEIGNKEYLYFEEFIPCKNVVKDKKGFNYNNECIVPFLKVSQ